MNRRVLGDEARSCEERWNDSTDKIFRDYVGSTFLRENRRRLVLRARTDEPEDDPSLLRRIASGDQEALSMIYDRHAGCVYGLLRRILRDESAAEEIAQDVFLHLWKIAARFDPERGALRPWLLVMARNRAISHLRRRVQDDPNGLDEDFASAELPQDTAAAQNEIVGKVRDYLAQLPPEQSKLFELAYFSGMTHSEIAESTGQPLGTVKTRLRTTLTGLRQAFER
ncbi:MAG TPA: sigma-70 family RNA polymerase sigma factor [Acidobacteriaceae bacterium]|nr:sigma-70 family RNA polymerase sigma factor [Acidobacteriaceae bacterium]